MDENLKKVYLYLTFKALEGDDYHLVWRKTGKEVEIPRDRISEKLYAEAYKNVQNSEPKGLPKELKKIAKEYARELGFIQFRVFKCYTFEREDENNIYICAVVNETFPVDLTLGYTGI